MQKEHTQPDDCENAGLPGLILAFFAPVDSGKSMLNLAMLSAYAMLYMKRNGIAALIMCLSGIVLNEAGYAVSGVFALGLFVVFSGLFSAFAVAVVDNYRNPG